MIRMLVLVLCLLSALGCEDSPTEPSAPGTEVRFDGAGVAGSGSITRRIKNFGSRSACDIRWSATMLGETRTARIDVLQPGESVERTIRFGADGIPRSTGLTAEPC